MNVYVVNGSALTFCIRWKRTISAAESPIHDTTLCMAVSLHLQCLAQGDTLYLETTIASIT